MSRNKDAYVVGEINDLNLSEKLILEILRDQPVDNWGLVIRTKLSESSIIKALRKLKSRGLIIKEHNLNKVRSIGIIKKLKKEE